MHVCYVCYVAVTPRQCSRTYTNRISMKSFVFWDIPPWSPLKVNRYFGGTYRLHLQSRRISQARNQHESRWQAEQLCLHMLSRWFLACLYSSTLKMEMTCSFKTSVNFQRTTHCYIPEDTILHKHNCGNLKFYISSLRPKLRHLKEKDVHQLNSLV
jgi:hypothetical protein